MIPADQKDSATTARLINILRTGEVDVEEATSASRRMASTTRAEVISCGSAQPYGGFAKTLLEIQEYPNIPNIRAVLFSVPMTSPRRRSHCCLVSLHFLSTIRSLSQPAR